MSGDADDCFVTQQAAGGLGWEVVLAEMNAISVKSQSYVYAIVYYDPNAALTGYMRGFLRLFEKLARRQVLLAKLN
jgi:hypothetical protein